MQQIPATTPCPLTADLAQAALQVITSAVHPSTPFGVVSQVVAGLQQSLSIAAAMVQQQDDAKKEPAT